MNGIALHHGLLPEEREERALDFVVPLIEAAPGLDSKAKHMAKDVSVSRAY